MTRKGGITKEMAADTKPRSKRPQEESDEEDDLQVKGLLDLDAEEDDDSESESESVTDHEGADEEGEEEEEEAEDEEEDSDAELNRLLAEEEDEEESDYDSDGDSEPESIRDKISGVSLKTMEDEGYHTKYSDGQPRIIKPEIEPTYDSDDSDADAHNTIGNIPISAYEEMPHIGYDINGKRIMRPAKGSALEQLLEQIELPEGWTGLLDQNTGQSLNILLEELELIRKIQNNENTDELINPYEPTIEWFTSKTEVMPLSAAPEPKRRFMPSQHEAKRIMKIVRAIRDGKIIPPSQVKEKNEEEAIQYDLWEKDGETNDHVMNLRAPKLAPPTHELSYNPPEEYLPTEEERKAREAQDPAERNRKPLPQKYTALRKVPGYANNIVEVFNRSLDLYLAPRVRRSKMKVDPELLIPEMPSPKDLRPFPIKCSTIFEGHTGRIRSLSIDSQGLWLATGSDDGTVRVWEILTGRQVYSLQAVDTAENPEDKIDSVAWNPECLLLAVACAEHVLLVVPPIFGFDIENDARVKVEAGWGYGTFGNKRKDTAIDVNSDGEAEDDKANKKEVAKWYTPSTAQAEQGVVACIECKKPVKKLSWHRKGDYFVTVLPEAKHTSVLIHQVSKHLSQSPFRKAKGIIVDARFHPSKPQLFVSSQRTIRIYDLAQQVLIKKLMPGARMLSGIDIHPRGDHLLALSYDRRVLWHDLDLSAMPYKTLRYHEKAVRSVKFHAGRLPLFATASDDGSIHVFHGTVYDDFMTNPLLVPLKKLTGHSVVSSIGVLDLVWHPKEAWLFSAGADGTARLWTT